MASAAPSLPSLEAAVSIADDSGLHARPSVALSQLAKRFAARVELTVGESGPWINAKSATAVLRLKASRGEILSVRAEGEDARQAIDALIALVARGFDAP